MLDKMEVNCMLENARWGTFLLTEMRTKLDNRNLTIETENGRDLMAALGDCLCDGYPILDVVGDIEFQNLIAELPEREQLALYTNLEFRQAFLDRIASEDEIVYDEMDECATYFKNYGETHFSITTYDNVASFNTYSMPYEYEESQIDQLRNYYKKMGLGKEIESIRKDLENMFDIEPEKNLEK